MAKITAQTAVEAAKTLVEFCNQQRSCQNCIFRRFGCDHWKCHMDCFDLADVLRNIAAKKKNRGWL